MSLSRIARGVALLALIPSWLGLLGGWHWLLDLFAHFRWEYLIISAVVIVWAMWRRQRGIAVLAAVTFLLNAVLIATLAFDSEVSEASVADNFSLRVLSQNVLRSNPDKQAVVDHVLASDADVVLLLEVDKQWMAALQTLQTKYPYSLAEPRANSFGIALFSRIPWSSAKILWLGDLKVPLVEVAFTHQGRNFVFIGTHTMSPVGGRRARLRDRQLQLLAEHVTQLKVPVLVVGDLNATPWSAGIRIATSGNLKFRSLSPPWTPTWRVGTIHPIPIDHALATAPLVITRRAVGPDVGSDHRSLSIWAGWARRGNRITRAVVKHQRPAVGIREEPQNSAMLTARKIFCRLRKMMHPRSALVALLLCGAAFTAWPHHGISNWDLNKDLTLTGRLTNIELINPHTWIHLDVRAADGKVGSWKCEMRSVNSLRRSGWTKEMFQIGSAITVTGSPERRKPNQCYLGTIIFADGSRMDRYGQRQLAVAQKATTTSKRALRTADGRPNLAGDWAAEQRVMSDPRGQLGALVPLSEAGKMKPGDVPPGQAAFPGARGSAASLAADPVKAAWDRPLPARLTDKGRLALQSFDPATRDNPRLRCEPTGIIFDWTFDAVVNRIEQTPARITMRYGHMDLSRVLYLDRKAPPADLRPSRTGYSIGRWEGNVLVVETTGFTPGVLSADARLLHGAKLRVVERFELDASGSKLSRSYTAEDPEYFADSWKGSDLVFPAEIPYERYSCRDPGGAPAGK
ncbi:MAG: DUF6152 family protein [Steroidobacteraceae bacterium]